MKDYLALKTGMSLCVELTLKVLFF